MSEDRRTVLAAAAVLAGLIAFAWFLPDIMLAAGGVSPLLAAVVVVVFLLGLFAVLWVRSRTRGR